MVVVETYDSSNKKEVVAGITVAAGGVSGWLAVEAPAALLCFLPIDSTQREGGMS